MFVEFDADEDWIEEDSFVTDDGLFFVYFVLKFIIIRTMFHSYTNVKEIISC